MIAGGQDENWNKVRTLHVTRDAGASFELLPPQLPNMKADCLQVVDDDRLFASSYSAANYMYSRSEQ